MEPSRSRCTTLACSLAFALLAGCDPGWKLEGMVRGAAGAPLPHASAVSICPDDAPPLPSAESDAEGALHGHGLGFFRDGCEIEVRAKGHAPKRFPVASVCRRRSMGSCLEVDVQATLSPTTP